MSERASTGLRPSLARRRSFPAPLASPLRLPCALRSGSPVCSSYASQRSRIAPCTCSSLIIEDGRSSKESSDRLIWRNPPTYARARKFIYCSAYGRSTLCQPQKGMWCHAQRVWAEHRIRRLTAGALKIETLPIGSHCAYAWVCWSSRQITRVDRARGSRFELASCHKYRFGRLSLRISRVSQDPIVCSRMRAVVGPSGKPGKVVPA